jgi:CBS domain-containing membrane protein
MGHVMHAGHPVGVPEFASRYSPRVVYAVFVMAASAVSIGTITAVAYGSGHPLVVPSLGPTAFLIFNRSQTPAARPRNAILGHLLGAVCGYVALIAFGLAHSPAVTQGGLTSARIGAAAVSIGLTTGSMIILGAEHGPAGATTLIVSLGFMTTISSLGLLMIGVVALAVEGVAIDRLAGLHIPYWSGPHPHVERRPLWRPSLLPITRNSIGKSRHPAGLTLLGPGQPKAVAHANGAWVIPPGEGRDVLIGTAQHCLVKIEDATSDGSYSLLEVTLDPVSAPILQHVHYGFSETYVVTEGKIVADIAGRTINAGPGWVIHVSAGVPHAISNTGRTPASCLCVTPHSQQSEPEYLP